MKYQAIRKTIKDLAKEQVDLKLQRKTKTFKGVRVFAPDEASYKHFRNRHKLRHLYMAYAELRGVERPAPTRGIYYKDEVKDLVEKYSEPKETVA